jgi:hypothetical protein
MAGPERFELPTFWFVAVAARRTNDLDGMLPVVTEYHGRHAQQWFPPISLHWVTLQSALAGSLAADLQISAAS